jgi:hypothetical protein
MSALDRMAQIDNLVAANLLRRANNDRYEKYIEAGGKRGLSDWLSTRLTEDDLAGWPSRQAGHMAERTFRPVGETL